MLRVLQGLVKVANHVVIFPRPTPSSHGFNHTGSREEDDQYASHVPHQDGSNIRRPVSAMLSDDPFGFQKIKQRQGTGNEEEAQKTSNVTTAPLPLQRQRQVPEGQLSSTASSQILPLPYCYCFCCV